MNRDDARFLEALGDVTRSALLADKSVSLPGVGVVMVAHRASRQFSDDHGTVVTAPARELVFDPDITLEQDAALEQASRLQGATLADARVLWQNALNRLATDKNLVLPGIGELVIQHGEPSCRFLPLLQHAVNAAYTGYVDLGLSRTAAAVEHTDAREREAVLASQVDYVDLVDRVIDEQDVHPAIADFGTAPAHVPDSASGASLDSDVDSPVDLTHDSARLDRWTPIDDVDSIIGDLDEADWPAEAADEADWPAEAMDEADGPADAEVEADWPADAEVDSPASQAAQVDVLDEQELEMVVEDTSAVADEVADDDLSTVDDAAPVSATDALEDIESEGFVALESDFLTPTEDTGTYPPIEVANDDPASVVAGGIVLDSADPDHNSDHDSDHDSDRHSGRDSVPEVQHPETPGSESASASVPPEERAEEPVVADLHVGEDRADVLGIGPTETAGGLDRNNFGDIDTSADDPVDTAADTYAATYPGTYSDAQLDSPAETESSAPHDEGDAITTEAEDDAESASAEPSDASEAGAQGTADESKTSRDRSPSASRRRGSGGVLVAVATVLVAALALTGWLMGLFGTSVSDSPATNDRPATAETVATPADNESADIPDASGENPADDETEPPQPAAPPVEREFQRGAIDLASGGFTIIVSSKETLAEAIDAALGVGDRDEPVDVLEAEVDGQMRYRVAVGQFRTFSLASRALNQASDQLPEGSWIGRIE